MVNRYLDNIRSFFERAAAEKQVRRVLHLPSYYRMVENIHLSETYAVEPHTGCRGYRMNWQRQKSSRPENGRLQYVEILI